MQPRRILLAVVIAFAASRLIAGYVAATPSLYDKHHINAVFEIGNYHNVAERMLTGGDRPYEDFRLEYPPGELPFFLVIDEIDPFSFQTQFVALCILVDAVGLAAIYRLARRTGSWWGVLAWLALIPLLGPLAYSRTDIFVATAIAWAFERAHAGNWRSSGAWLGFGAAVKLTPVLLLPAMLVVSRDRKRLLKGFTVVAALAVLPFLFQLNAMWHDVIRYHSDRGVQAESIWGSVVVAWRHLHGHNIGLKFAFGGWEISGGTAAALKTLSNLAAVLVLVYSVVAARLYVRRGDVARLAVLLTCTLILLVVSGRVLSPQYMVWLIGVTSVGLCFAPRALRLTAILIGMATVLSFVEFPFLWFELLGDEGHAIAVLVARNVCLLAAGVLALRAVWQQRPPPLQVGAEPVLDVVPGV